MRVRISPKLILGLVIIVAGTLASYYVNVSMAEYYYACGGSGAANNACLSSELISLQISDISVQMLLKYVFKFLSSVSSIAFLTSYSYSMSKPNKS